MSDDDGAGCLGCALVLGWMVVCGAIAAVVVHFLVKFW